MKFGEELGKKAKSYLSCFGDDKILRLFICTLVLAGTM